MPTAAGRAQGARVRPGAVARRNRCVRARGKVLCSALEHPGHPAILRERSKEGHGVHTRYYLAQELVDGKALDRLDDHWYSEAEIVDIASQVLGVLVYLQTLSPMVIHRDIKPANLMKRIDGSIALVDFGAAHVHGTTAGSTTIGTFGYMPIEQLAGLVDATTDGYALGATLLHLLTRQEPWRLMQTKTTLNVVAPLRAFLDKLTAADPRDGSRLAKDARAALDNRAALVPVKRSKSRRRMWPLVALVAGVLAMGGGVAGFHAMQSDDQVIELRSPGPTQLPGEELKSSSSRCSDAGGLGVTRNRRPRWGHIMHEQVVSVRPASITSRFRIATTNRRARTMS